MNVKLSDYVAAFLAEKGLRHAFVISGGASIHLMHSIADRDDIDAVFPHHEQAAAMSADAYARVTGRPGCAIGTSGPGATNMITGIAGAWFDSIPVLYLSGQVATFRMKGDIGIRQMGFQETDILPMVEPITKYAVQISDPKMIAYELEKAYHFAISDRPGPVLLDIPDDLQRQMIDLSTLHHYETHDQNASQPVATCSEDQLHKIISLLDEAKRPVFIAGWGIRLADGQEEFKEAIELMNMPVLTSWAVKDMIEETNLLLAGTFGTHGVRAGNFTVQNADLVIAVGARLSTHETGTPMNSWARGAKVVVVDIDASELRKFEIFEKPLELAINADAKTFLESLVAVLRERKVGDYSDWNQKVADWKARYPVIRSGCEEETVDPYGFMKTLSVEMSDDQHVFVDTGCSVAWMMQAFPVRGHQRLFHDFNNTAMGWALPAAIGGCFALGGRPVTCVSGDGSIMMNIHELATINRHALPIKLFIMNNNGYSMVQQTQEQWLESQYVGTSREGGLSFPNFSILAKAFEIPTIVVEKNSEVRGALKEAFELSGPVLVDVIIPSSERVTPQSRFGYPIEDSEPLLPRDEFLSNMIVDPLSKSREPIE